MYKKTRRKYNKRRKTKKIKGGGDLTCTVMSYNVLARGATKFQHEKHNFKFEANNSVAGGPIVEVYEHIEQTIQRYEKIKREIENQDPDIVLLQEVDNYFFTYILKHLNNYRGYFKQFVPNLKEKDLSLNFSTAVLWNNQKFILDTDHTKTMVLDNKRANDDRDWKEGIKALYRGKMEISFGNKNATLVTLKSIAIHEKIVTAVSFHLPGDDNKLDGFTIEKQNLTNYILHELSKHNNTFKIIGGDLNYPIDKKKNEESTTEEHKKQELDTENSRLEELVQTIISAGLVKIDQSGTNITTCDFDYSNSHPDAEIIDTIFHSQNIETTNYKVQKLSCPNGPKSVPVYAERPGKSYSNVINGSDHAWILATLKLK